MQSNWKKYELMLNYPAALRKASNTTNHIIVKLAEGLLEELRTQDSVLSPHSYTRSKRGAIDVVGNVANSLFGILDSKYTERAERDIELIKKNENYLIDQLQNQTSFLDATMNLFKKSQEDINHELQHVSNILMNMENKITGEMEFTELAMHAVFDMFQYERLQDALSEVLLSSHHGKLSPHLISPIQLRKELDKIKAMLPSNLQLPASIDNLLNFYILIRIEGRAMNNHIIFKLTLDLLHDEIFEVLKIIPVPWQTNQVVYQIYSDFKLFVINLHRDEYLPLKETEINSCHLIDDQRCICHKHHPLYKTRAAIASCEVQLLTHQTNSSCKIEQLETRPYWIQLQNPNIWIYSVQSKYTLNAVCGPIPNQIVLQYSGTLHLDDDCNIKQPEISIQGYQHLESKGNAFYIPNNDVETFISTPRSIIQQAHINLLSSDIDELKGKTD